MASGWNLWVWLVSVVVRRYIYIIDILIIIITFPYSTFINSFLAVSSLFLCSFFLYFINRDERGFPLTQYITNGGISSARNTSTHCKHHHPVLRLISNHPVLRLISNRMSV